MAKQAGKWSLQPEGSIPSLVRRSVTLMTGKERLKLGLVVVARISTSLLDLAGVSLIGYLAASTAASLSLSVPSGGIRHIALAGLQIPAATADNLPSWAVLILGILTAKALLSLYFTKVAGTLLAGAEARAARAVAESVLGSSLLEYARVSREKLLFAATSGTSAAFTGMLTAALIVLSEGSLFLVLLAAFMVVDWQATLGVLAYFSIIGACMQLWIGPKLSRLSETVSHSLVQQNVILNDFAVSFREITSYGKRDQFLSRIRRTRLSASESIGRQQVYVSVPRYLIELALLVGILVLGAVKVLQGDLSSAALTLGVFLSGGMRLTAAMLPMQQAFLAMRQCQPQAQVALQLIVEDRDREDGPSQTIVRLEKPPKITFSNVAFKYSPEVQATLQHLTIDLPAGEHAVITGPSGSGKSTFVDLLLGLLTPTEGKIALDGISPSDHLGQIAGVAYVPQKPGLVTGSIRDNLTLGAEGIGFASSDLLTALGKVGLEKKVLELDQGLDTLISSDQSLLSGGQVQRLGLARALISNPKLLVLDEATSALDSESELVIRKVIGELRGACTVVSVAHRKSIAQDAETLINLVNGEVRLTQNGTASQSDIST